MRRRHDDRQPTLFDAAPAPGDGPAAPAAVGEPDAAYRPGFRWVKRIGWVPEDWQLCHLLEVVHLASGQVDPREEPYKSMILIAPDHVESSTGRLLKHVSADDQGAISGKYLFKPGDIVYSKIRPYLRKAVLVDFEGLCSADMYPLTPVENISPGFMLAVLLGERFSSFAEAVSMRSGIPKINRVELAEFVVALPPASEQRKIARILGAWDGALARLDALIAAKEQRLKGLAQRLLTGEVRLPKYEDQPWKEKRIGSLLKAVKRPVEWDDDELYRLISLRRGSAGLFFRDPLYGHQIKTKNLMTVHTGDFLISKMQVVHGATGVVTPEFDSAHVSGSYIILVPRKEDTVNTTFYAWLAKLPYMYHVAYLSSYGVHIEKMTFNPKLYFKTKIMVPSTVEEQRDIVALLNAAEAEIDLLRQERNALAKQKKGLMQRLLTGAVRVTPDAEDSEQRPVQVSKT